jgi:hypothetical protein
VVVEKEVIVIATAMPAQEGKYFFRNLDPNPTYGGKLTIASHGPPAHFELYASSSISNAGSQAVMVDNLVRRDIRDVQRFPVIPDLAYRWEYPQTPQPIPSSSGKGSNSTTGPR